MKIPVSFKFKPETIAKLKAMNAKTSVPVTAILEKLVEQADYTAPVTLQKQKSPQSAGK